jgi:hypothetical protein
MTALGALVDCNGFYLHSLLAFHDIKYMPLLLFLFATRSPHDHPSRCLMPLDITSLAPVDHFMPDCPT